MLWRVVYDSFDEYRYYRSMDAHPYLSDPWPGILQYLHIYSDRRTADEFENDANAHIEAAKRIFETRRTGKAGQEPRPDPWIIRLLCGALASR